MRISDWSSDVCSSDLSNAALVIEVRERADGAPGFRHRQCYLGRDRQLMLGRIGKAAVTEVGALQPGRRGDEVNVILIICLEIGILEGHVEHVRRSEEEFNLDALEVPLRGVG